MILSSPGDDLRVPLMHPGVSSQFVPVVQEEMS